MATDPRVAGMYQLFISQFGEVNDMKEFLGLLGMAAWDRFSLECTREEWHAAFDKGYNLRKNAPADEQLPLIGAQSD